MSERYPMNIEQDIFDSWKMNQGKGDAEELCEKLQRSRPTIDHALKYGHVKEKGLILKITSFFNARLARQQKKAGELIEQIREI